MHHSLRTSSGKPCGCYKTLCISHDSRFHHLVQVFITRWQEFGKMCRLFIISGNCRCRNGDMKLAV